MRRPFWPGFRGSGDPLPPSFLVYPTFAAHGVIAALLVGLIVLHLLAALYHQFVRKDGLLRRMLLWRRVSPPPLRRWGPAPCSQMTKCRCIFYSIN